MADPDLRIMFIGAAIALFIGAIVAMSEAPESADGLAVAGGLALLATAVVDHGRRRPKP